MLARREHTRVELEHKLAARGFGSDLIADVLDALERERLLSNSRFTEQFIHQRTRRGPGPLKIIHELIQRGIDEATAREIIGLSDPIWTENARQARLKRFGDNPPKSFKERARQSRFLEQRGFSFDQIKSALATDDADDNEN